MTTEISTRDVAIPDREGFWRDTLQQSFAPVDLVTLDSTRLSGSVRTTQAGAMGVAQVASSAQEIRRTRHHIDNQAEQLIHLVVATSGSGILHQDDRMVHMQPGQITIYETARPFEVRYENHWEAAVLTMPRHLVPLTTGDSTRLTARPLIRDPHLSRHVCDTITDVVNHMDSLPAPVATRLMTSLGSLVMHLAHGELQPRSSPTDDVTALGPTHDLRRARLLAAVKDHIEETLTDPWLTPAMIAETHHLSVRSLHHLFAPTGTTVAAYVRRRRLSLAARLLRDPALHDHPIATIANRAGFNDLSGFGRAFKTAYGTSPSNYRTPSRSR